MPWFEKQDLYEITADLAQPREECLKRQPVSQDYLSCLMQTIPGKRDHRPAHGLHSHTNFLSPKPLPCSKGSQPAHPPSPPERGYPHCVCAKTVSSAKVRLSSLSVLCLQTLTIFISVTDFIPFLKPFLKIQSGGPFWYSNRNSFSHSSAGWKSKIKTRLIFCIHLE